MGRDEQFEVQYLLSLMVVVLGLTTSNMENIIHQSVGIGFLFISSLHLLLLTAYYSLEKGTEFTLPIVGTLRGYSQFTLQLTTLGFIYLLSHGICFALLRGYAVPVWRFSQESVQRIITFGLPIVPVGIVSGTFLKKVWKPFRISRDISMNIVPDNLRLYPEFADGEPVLIELLNEGSKKYKITLSIELPEQVVAEVDREVHLDGYQEELNLKDDRTPIHIRFRHNSQEERKEIIRVQAVHEHGVLEDEIECLLRP